MGWCFLVLGFGLALEFGQDLESALLLFALGPVLPLAGRLLLAQVVADQSVQVSDC